MFNFICSLTLVLICLGSTVVDSFITRTRIVTRCTSKAITVEHNEVKRSGVAHCKSWLVLASWSSSVFWKSWVEAVKSHQFSRRDWLDFDYTSLVSSQNVPQTIWVISFMKDRSLILKPQHLWRLHLNMTLTARLLKNKMFDSACSSCQRKALRITSLSASSGGASSGPKKSSKSCTVCKGKGTNLCVPCAGSGDRRFHLPLTCS